MDYSFETNKMYKVFDKDTGSLIDEGVLEAGNVLSTIHRVEIADAKIENNE